MLMKRLLLHPRLDIRFLSLYALAAALFLAVWVLSYFLLPEGVLRGKSGAAALAGSEPAGGFLAEWLRISAINLIVGTLFVVALNLLKTHGYPLGYAAPLAWAINYTILLGTNSFSIPLPAGKMAPSLAVLGHSGPYEIAAYVLAAAATYSLPRYKIEGPWLREKAEPIPPADRPAFRTEQWIGLGLSVILLLGACAWEAYGIVTHFG